MLRAAFGMLLPRLEECRFCERPLHGEPHDGNRLLTAAGVRWIDFEGSCRGPVEWDLTFLTEVERHVFGPIDDGLLALLSTLNSAPVATWCWARARFAEMRWHGQRHLDLVQASLPD